jgi:1-acyl-sn-glycerol-3-phosphate acyltransferase
VTEHSDHGAEVAAARRAGPPSPPWPLHFAYGTYAWGTFVVLALVALVGVVVLPSLSWRRGAVRGAARAWLFIAGMSVSVRSPAHLPDGQCVIVANHASYLDGVVYTAILPPRFGFVIKREMEAVPLAGLLLRRIGSQFVERFNRSRSARDARRVFRTASHGHSLVFFPEGTFSPEPGLLHFHTGAFVTAVRAGCAVVPSVIRGTRTALPCSTVLPRPGRIEVEFFPPIGPPPDSGETSATALRDDARAVILRELGEPDRSAHG